MSRSSVARWSDRLYPTEDSRDTVPRFLRLVEAGLQPDARVLEVGAGGGRRNPHRLRGRCAELVGVDLDPRVLDNPLVDRGVVADVRDLPFEDGSFDLSFSLAVLEHLDDPVAFAAEMQRVLRPGGLLLALTPNRHHYVPLVAMLTPQAFHRWVNERRGRPAADTFPTSYRLNSARALRAHLGRAGFACRSLERIEVRPNYLDFSLPTFLLGAAYERLVNRFAALAFLRVNLIAVFERL